MKPSPTAMPLRRSPVQSSQRGFSAIELVITMTLILILSAIATPFLLRAVKMYQLNDSATRLAGMLKLTRFEAIRNNTKIGCGFQQTGTTWTVWKDTNGNGNIDVTEMQLSLGGMTDLLPAGTAGMPSNAPIAATIGGGGTLALTVLSGANGLIKFDARGAVDFAGAAPTVYVLYIGNAIDSSYGYRAILVFPAGTTQVWSTASGTWQRTS
jgi:prepilin-type N-terminal cleavage/methylation domain-containing protein